MSRRRKCVHNRHSNSRVGASPRETKTDRFVVPRERRASYLTTGPKTTIWRLAVPLKRVNPSVWPSADRLRTKKIHFPFVHSFSHVPRKGRMPQWHNVRTPRQLIFAFPDRSHKHTHAYLYILDTHANIKTPTHLRGTIIATLLRIRTYISAKVKYARISPAKIVTSSGSAVGSAAPDRCFRPVSSALG